MGDTLPTTDQRTAAIRDIADLIGDQRDDVASAIGASIRAHIGGKSPSECLGLVVRDRSGSIVQRLPMALDAEYGKALIAFVRGKEFEGRPLDSALTDSTSERVADVFAEKVGERAGEISDRLLPLLLSDQRFISAIASAMVEAWSGPIPQHLKGQVISALSGKLSTALTQTIDMTTTATIKASIGKTAAAVSTPIGAKMALVLVTTMSVALKPIILKLLASTAFKAAIMTKLKAVIVGAMLGAFFKIIGVKLGLSAGAVFVWVILPLVLAWLAYEVSTFPEKLADKVSESVVAEVTSDFGTTSATMAESLVDSLLSQGAIMLADRLIDDEALAAALADCIAAAA